MNAKKFCNKTSHIVIKILYHLKFYVPLTCLRQQSTEEELINTLKLFQTKE